MTARDGSNKERETDAERRALFRRDAIIRELWTALDEDPGEARAAGRRLDARIAAACKDELTRRREQQRVKVSLLPIAKEMAIDPEKLKQPSGMDLDWNKPPKGFDPLGVLSPNRPVPEWASRVFKAVGKFDRDIASQLENFTGHIRNAATGHVGGVQIEAGVDIRKISGLEAYVHAISRLWSRGRYSKKQVREELTGRVRVPKGMKGHSVLLGEVDRFSKMARELPAGADAWWDIALLVRVLVDPEFEPKSVGCRLLPAWDTDGLFDDRSGVFEFRADEEKVPGSEFWLTAERAVRWLKSSRSRARTRTKGGRTARKRSARKRDEEPEGRSRDRLASPTAKVGPDLDTAEPHQGLDSTRPYIDEDAGCLVFEGKRCRLGRKSSPAFRLMVELCANPEKTFETDELGVRVWPSRYRNNLNRIPVVVGRCRAAFRRDDLPESIILTEARGTYRLGPKLPTAPRDHADDS